MKKANYLIFNILMALGFVLAVPGPAAAQDVYPDVDGDGVVNIADLVIIVDRILGVGTGGVTPAVHTDYLSAKDFGAVGDGVTDDTDALEHLFEEAFQQKKAAFFDPGTYLIRRSLTLRTGMEIYGKEATITKKPASVTSLMVDVSKGQTFIDVLDARGFTVGDQFFIVQNQSANLCTYAIVDSIVGNRIHFTNIISDLQPNYPGCINNYIAGTKVSTSFALLRSWATRFDCDGVSIHDLTLDGNRTISEPKSWANSCIHMDSYYPGGYAGSTTGIEYCHPQGSLVARNLVIKNSSHDGISDQSEGGLVVTDCIFENNAVHGVHMGTRFVNGMISNNTMTGNGSNGSGVFFCENVSDVIIENNEISLFNHGCSDEELGTSGKNLIIRNNQFNNITSYVFDFLKATSSNHGGRLQIHGNKIDGLKSQLFAGCFLDNVIITGNEVTSVNKSPSKLISATQSQNVIITGNSLPSGVTIATPVVSTSTGNLIDESNTWN